MEGDLLSGIVARGIAPTEVAAQVEVASRTDRGVHARANALGITSRLGGLPLLRALNGISPHVFFTAARPVPPGFSVRTARTRWYRYFEPLEGVHVERWRAAAALFHGYVDVRSFGADLPADAPAWRQIERVSVRPLRGILRVDLKAPSFVWKEVRKIIGALRAHDQGRVTLAQLQEALRGGRRLTLPLADPERLVLWDVEYDEPWMVTLDPSTLRRHGRAGPNARGDARARHAVIEGLWPPLQAAPLSG